MSKYQVFEGVNRKSGSKQVIVVTHFAGNAVRGIAKCDTNSDEYDRQCGVDLAKARCDEKFYEKKKAHAEKKYLDATIALEEARARLEQMKQYLNDATADYRGAVARVAELESETK